jgi:serine/threonine protein kinase
MRFIRGDTLKDAITPFHQADRPGGNPGERMLALRQLLAQFVSGCNVVGYTHSRGVLHRDIKPANVLLGKFGEALLVDWGLAKVVRRAEGEWGDGEVTLRPLSGSDLATQAGAALGTPAFKSPEPAAGEANEIVPTPAG